MKRPTRFCRLPIRLSESIHQQLNMYALARQVEPELGCWLWGSRRWRRLYTGQTHVNISPNTSYTVRLWNPPPLFTLANY